MKEKDWILSENNAKYLWETNTGMKTFFKQIKQTQQYHCVPYKAAI